MSIKLLVAGECYYSRLPRTDVVSLRRILTLPNPRYQQAVAFSRMPAYAIRAIPQTLEFFSEPANGVICVPRGLHKLNVDVVKKSISKHPVKYPTPVLLPRKWQKSAISEWSKHKNDAYFDGCLVASPGQGKTICGLFLAAALGQRALVVVHTEQILRGWIDDIHEVFGGKLTPTVIKGAKKKIGPTITIAMIQTLRNMPAEDWAQSFGLVIVDECFPAGTLVDGKPIETYKPGDTVISYDHKNNKLVRRRVKQVFKSPVKRLVKITLSNGTVVISTEGHPFYSAGKYIPAAHLTSGSTVLTIDSQEVSNDQANNIRKAQVCCVRESGKDDQAQVIRLHKDGRESGTPVMFTRMQSQAGSGSSPAQREVLGEVQPQVCIQEDDRVQPDARSSYQSEGQHHFASHGASAEGSRRERSGTDCAAEDAGICVGVGHGDSYSDAQGSQQRIPNLLQGGCGQRGLEDSSGRGRRFPRFANKEGSGSEKGCTVREVRVESVEILEQESAGGYGSVCAGGYVYNLHVEETENYFAEGILVHNCHRSPALSYYAALKSCEAAFRIGLTATFERTDGLGQLITWTCGPLRYTAPVDEKAVVPLKIIRLKTPFILHKPGKEPANKEFPQSTFWLRQMRNRKRVKTICWLARFVTQWSKKAGPALIVTARQEMCEDLQRELAADGSEYFHYKLKAEERIDFIKRARAGKVPITIATATMLAEGVNVPIWTHLLIVQSYSSPILARQVVGRVERAHPSKEKGYVYDFVDDNFICIRQFAKRFDVYRRIHNVEFTTFKITEPVDGKCRLLKPV